MESLTEYEAEQVRRIALWKAERPGRLLTSYRALTRPISKWIAKVVPGGMVRATLAKVEAASEIQDTAADIIKAAGIGAIPDLLHRPLEECDGLADRVSVRSEHCAMLEGVLPAAVGVSLPGVGSAVAGAVDIPFLLESSLRAVRRVGHCYGFALDTEADRRFVLAVLDIASQDEPAGVEQERLGLWASEGPPERKLDGSEASEAVAQSIVDDLPVEAIPIVGDVANLVMDYAFVRRADVAARRVFQERWLRVNGKVESIPPAAGSPRRSSFEGVAAVASEVAYVGAYGVSFGVTFPAALIGRAVDSVAPGSVKEGFRDGASAAARDSKGLIDRAGLGLGALTIGERPALAGAQGTA